MEPKPNATEPEPKQRAMRPDQMSVDPVVADFPEGMNWYPGGRAVASPLGATPGVHAGGTLAEPHPATVKVAVLEDGSALLGVELLGAPALPVGAVHIPQDKLADVIAALSAAPPVAE